MKVIVQQNGKLSAECMGESDHEVFKQISKFQEMFQDNKCGLCSSENLQYVVRAVEDNEFYELRCKVCYAKLTFGTSKADKKLYPKRFATDDKGKALKDKDGKGIKLGKNGNGWVKFNKEIGKEE